MNWRNLNNRVIQIKSLGGRLLESSKLEPQEGGFYGIIDVKNLNRNGNRVEKAQFDYSGDSLIMTDTSGNLLLVHIKKNRFISLAKGINATALQFLDKNMIFFAIANSQRKVEIYNSQGNKIESLEGHKTAVFRIECNFLKEQFFSVSKDQLILWDLKTFTKIKALTPKHANTIVEAFFSKDAQSLTTVFNDSTAYEWNLNSFDLRAEIKFPEYCTAYTQSSYNKFYFAGGKNDRLISIDLARCQYQDFWLPFHCKKILQAQSLSRENKLSFLADDNHVSIVDFDRSGSVVARVGCQGKAIVSYQIDAYNKNLLFITQDGQMHLYDLKGLYEYVIADQKQRIKAGEP
jgi:WD40 repeat protein